MKPASSNEIATQEERLARRRRINAFRGLNSSTAILLALILVLMVNYLASRHYRRFDVTTDHRASLSGRTRELLATLETPVRVTVIIQPDHELFHLFYEDLRQLLEQYRHASRGRFMVERIDPDRDPGRAGEIMTRLQLDDPNILLIEQGERMEIIKAGELAEIDYGPVLQGGLPRKKSFKGELIISSAIFRLGNREPARVYYLQGHGERDFDDHDPYTGSSRIASRVRRDHIELIPLEFVESAGVPGDADAVIVAAPSREFSPAEISRLREYFKNNGNILLMLDAETDAGFAPLLAEWGVRSVNSIVVDPARTLSGYEVVANRYENHPVTARLAGLNTVFYWPRSLPVAPSDRQPGQPLVTPLVRSSEDSWAELNLDQRPPLYNQESDIQGPLPVAVAIEPERSGVGSMGIEQGRAIVLGDAEFISNTGLTGANADLLLNALNWMLDRSAMLDIPPREETGQELLIESRGMRLLFWLVVVVLPLSAASFGIGVWWKRRT